MIKSMTGYGKDVYEDDLVFIEVEIKALNSKYLDASLRLSRLFAEKDIDIRTILGKELQRGKINLSIDIRTKGEAKSKVKIDKDLFTSYYNELRSLEKDIGSNSTDLFRMALQMPDVITNIVEAPNSEKYWQLAQACINNAIHNCDSFRNEEGKNLAEAMTSNIKNIEQFLKNIEVQDPERVINLKQKLKGHILESLEKGEFDENRLEQEIIYYIEKLDINEEKVRLRSHLQFFLETMLLPDSQGKKLGFISQEIGREINTIGSKANDAVIQRNVVGMKEELEMIKEQIGNIL